MSDSRAVFGRILSAPTIEQGCELTVRRWLGTYLGEVLEQAGFSRRSLPDPVDIVRVSDFAWVKDGTLPLVVVSTPGTVGDAVREAETYSASWEVVVMVVADLGERLETRQAAQLYAAAVGAALSHQGVAKLDPDGSWSLDNEGFPETLEGAQTDWIGEAYQQLPADEERSLIAGGARVLVTVEGARSRFGGPEVLPPVDVDPRDPVEGPDAGPLTVGVETDLVAPDETFSGSGA